jgi:hypothetical protein
MSICALARIFSRVVFDEKVLLPAAIAIDNIANMAIKNNIGPIAMPDVEDIFL